MFAHWKEDLVDENLEKGDMRNVKGQQDCLDKNNIYKAWTFYKMHVHSHIAVQHLIKHIEEE